MDITANTAELGETARLAAFCSATSFDDLDDDTVTGIRRAVVDTLAACYAGTRTAAGDRILEYVDETARGASTVIGSDRSSLRHFAALANGTTAHALDVDDGHRQASAHPGAATIPAALVIGETRGATGEDLVTAIAVGYEAMIKTAVAVQTSHRERGFHATATCGCFGAAATVAHLLDLDAERTAHALGLAGTQAGGLFEFLEKGSMAKRFHPGRAALAGVLAGELAAIGFDGPDTIIEGTDGFARGFADGYDLSVFDDLGNPFEAARSYIKPYPACRHAHGPIDAAKVLRDRGIDPDDVESIRVETYRSAAYHDKTNVENLLDAQMSIPYAVAVALVTGDGRLPQFDPPRIDDPQVARLLDRIDVVQTDEMEARYPESRPARVVVETTTTTDTVEEFVEYPLGAPENPVSEAQLRTKFRNLTDGILGDEDRTRILDTAFDIAALDDAVELTRVL